jgi:hypothetical protein
MVAITFPDRDTEKKALGFLFGRFSGHVLSSGEHLVPEAALEALAVQNIPLTVKGKATYEHSRRSRFRFATNYQVTPGQPQKQKCRRRRLKEIARG